MQEYPQLQYCYHHTTPTLVEPDHAVQRLSPFPSPSAAVWAAHNNTLWPSMLAGQPQDPYTPILPAPPGSTPVFAGSKSDMIPTSAGTNTSRRKLTDEERRQMCIEAEQHPEKKQSEIGAKFNVERSTVSKILGQRDKYMNPQTNGDRVSRVSPIKTSKAKSPDIEKTLTNWVKNRQENGLSVTDEDLQNQAHLYSCRKSGQATTLNTDWLEEFKGKTGLIDPKVNPNATLVNPSSISPSQTALDGSPTSSNGLVSPPMSTIEEHTQGSTVKIETHTDPFGVGDRQLTPETQRVGTSRIEGADDAFGTSYRPSSQTYSHAPGLRTGSHPSSHPRQMGQRHKSDPNIDSLAGVPLSPMQPPPLPRPVDTSPVNSTASPAEEDIIRALHAVKELLERNPTMAEPNDYVVIGKLMQIVKTLYPTRAPPPGGMHPIDIIDSPRISKKRAILDIST
ncbi:uncharacterized protein PV07_12748 [Cladophialophora immunda]|uniref:HTH CENPB-type domain-containing protein n=1 Tax=Cladophialophora immunda TaxID=569365 RepID=A0A0D2BRZ0_9EURO|nr:uncharacterized protein PV07_12748 [Cladophialophora immunda]KIW21828.1 hypothetical protein PV07_12748 [Cladophialophora immunda]